jgi:CIC family chloride channel protein
VTRFDSPQPNVTGLGIIASYTWQFWSLVVTIGVLAGLGAAGLTWILHEAEHLSYGGHHATLLAAVDAAAGWRRIAALVAAAVIVVGGLALLGRNTTGGTEVSEAIWLRSGVLDFPRSVARGLISIITVGMGVSLGREAAPQLFGAACASQLAKWAKLPTWQRRLLVASGAGAGFAAIYNVPLGGALMALEVLLGTLALSLVIPALLCAVTATAVAWIFIGDKPLYHVAAYPFHASQLVFAILAGPIIGLVAIGWTRLIAAANHARPAGWGRYLAPFAVFAGLGLLSLQYPQLLGNGRGIIQLTFDARLGLGLLAILFVLKPLVTAACIASGAPGGLFTPTFTVGVLLTGFLGGVWNHIWPGSASPAYALIGGGAFLAAAMQGPIAGVVLVLELTSHFQSLLVPTLIAVVEATVITRRLGGASIYSARLASGATLESSPTANAAAVAAIYALDETSPPESLPGPLPARD